MHQNVFVANAQIKKIKTSPKSKKIKRLYDGELSKVCKIAKKTKLKISLENIITIQTVKSKGMKKDD